MVLFFGHVNVLLTISFILLELGLTPLRENIVVILHLSCLVIIFLIILLLQIAVQMLKNLNKMGMIHHLPQMDFHLTAPNYC